MSRVKSTFMSESVMPLVMTVGPHALEVLSGLFARPHPDLMALGLGQGRPPPGVPQDHYLEMLPLRQQPPYFWGKDCYHWSRLDKRPLVRNAWLHWLSLSQSPPIKALNQHLKAFYRQQTTATLQVLLVADLGHALGCSLLIDLAGTIMALSPPAANLPQVWLYGILPESEKLQQVHMAYATLQELRRFRLAPTRPAGYPLGYEDASHPQLRAMRLEQWPFYRVYLYEASPDPADHLIATLGAWNGAPAQRAYLQTNVNVDNAIAQATEAGRFVCGTTRTVEITLPIRAWRRQWEAHIVRRLLPAPQRHADPATLAQEYQARHQNSPLYLLQQTLDQYQMPDQLNSWPFDPPDIGMPHYQPGNLTSYHTFVYQARQRLQSGKELINELASPASVRDRLQDALDLEERALRRWLSQHLRAGQTPGTLQNTLAIIAQQRHHLRESVERHWQNLATQWWLRVDATEKLLDNFRNQLHNSGRQLWNPLNWFSPLHQNMDLVANNVSASLTLCRDALRRQTALDYLDAWQQRLDQINQELDHWQAFWQGLHHQVTNTPPPESDPVMQAWADNLWQDFQERQSWPRLTWEDNLVPSLGDHPLVLGDDEHNQGQVDRIASDMSAQLAQEMSLLRFLRETGQTATQISAELAQAVRQTPLQLTENAQQTARENAWLLLFVSPHHTHERVLVDDLTQDLRRQFGYDPDDQQYLQQQPINDPYRLTLLIVTELIDIDQGLTLMPTFAQRYDQSQESCLHVFTPEAIAYQLRQRLNLQNHPSVLAQLYDLEGFMTFWKAAICGLIQIEGRFGYLFNDGDTQLQWNLKTSSRLLDGFAHFLAYYQQPDATGRTVQQSIDEAWQQRLNHLELDDIDLPQLADWWQQARRRLLDATRLQNLKRYIASSYLFHQEATRLQQLQAIDEDESSFLDVSRHLLSQQGQNHYEDIRKLVFS